MKLAGLLLLLVIATGAVSGAAEARPAETIRYDTSACFGFCPSYVVTVSADGAGLFEGRGHTAVRGTRRFHVAPSQFAAFRASLASVRPRGERWIEPGRPECRGYATDSVTIDVRWEGARSGNSHLRFYEACDLPERDRLRAVLAAAPGLLPIAALIGPAHP